MNHNAKIELREFIKQALKNCGDENSFADCDSLFVSGRLDSLSMMLLVTHLEKSFSIDFSKVTFEVSLIDSVNDIESFVDTRLEG